MFPAKSSLFAKLIALFVCGLILVAGANSLYFYFSATKRAETRLQLQAQEILNRISRQFVYLLQNAPDDELEVAIILEMAQEDVLAIVLKDKQGAFYMGKIKDEQWGISFYQPNAEMQRRLSASYIQLSREMLKDGQPVGTVELYVSDKSLMEQRRYLSTQLIAHLVLLFVLMTLLFMLTLRKCIIKPLAALKKAVEHFEKKDFSPKVPVVSQDEIGQLAQAFNRMGEHLNECMNRTELQIQQIKEAAIDKEELLIDLKNKNERLNKEITERKESETRMRELKQSLEKWLEERTADLKEANDLLQLQVAHRKKTKSDLKAAYADLDSLQAQLIQAEKLASIGQLSAGIAHEINNPLGFIGSNIYVFEKYIQELAVLNKKVQDLLDVTKSNDLEKVEGIFSELVEYTNHIDPDYIFKDLKNLLGETKSGIDRIKNITTNLRTFSRTDEDKMVDLNINDLIEGILNIVWCEIKFKCELKKEYGAVPPVSGNTQKIGQVFINLFINAAQSIEKKGIITIRTYSTGSFVCAEITDTGRGMAPEVLQKIFEPFYTTKKTGEGTGLGLSISAEIIQSHNGQIEVESQAGCGSTFTVSLPSVRDPDAG